MTRPTGILHASGRMGRSGAETPVIDVLRLGIEQHVARLEHIHVQKANT